MIVTRIGHADLTAEVWTLGAALQAVEVPDRDGTVSSVVLGCRDEAARRASQAYLGEIVGPYGNRISGASFTLDGATHHLDANFLGKHTLHGGSAGFSTRDWEVEDRCADAVTLRLDWRDTAGAHPGRFTVRATYRVEGHTLSLVTETTSDAPTVANPVSHPYFNLGSPTVDDHVLQVAASWFLPGSHESIPTPDAPAPVRGPLDLRDGQVLSLLYHSDDPQLAQFGGPDHCFVLEGEGMRPVASLACAASGRRVTIETDAVGLQVYGGMFLADEPLTYGPDGEPYAARAGAALETQGFPDAPNRPDFPTTVLRPGEVQRAEVRWTFTTF